VPYEYNFPSKLGWWSGFKPVDTVLASPPTASFVVNDTEPIFFYCSAKGSCTDFQMVGAINPVSLEHVDTSDKANVKTERYDLLG
jgi:hypothetical protein